MISIAARGNPRRHKDSDFKQIAPSSSFSTDQSPPAAACASVASLTQHPGPEAAIAIETPGAEAKITRQAEAAIVAEDDEAEIARMLGLVPEQLSGAEVSTSPTRKDPQITGVLSESLTLQALESQQPPTGGSEMPSIPPPEALVSFQSAQPANADAPTPRNSPGPETSVLYPQKRSLRGLLVSVSMIVIGSGSTYIILRATDPNTTASLESRSVSSSPDPAPSVEAPPTPNANSLTAQVVEPLHGQGNSEALPAVGPTAASSAPGNPVVEAPSRTEGSATVNPHEQAVAPKEPTPLAQVTTDRPTHSPSEALVEKDITRYASASASSTLPPDVGFHFRPSNLLDGKLETSWQASAKSREGVGESFTLRFARPHLISSLEIANGYQYYWKGQDLFLMNARLATIDIDFGERTERFSLNSGSRGYVRIRIEPPVMSSRIKVRAVTTHSGSRWPDLAVSDIRVSALTPAR